MSIDGLHAFSLDLECILFLRVASMSFQYVRCQVKKYACLQSHALVLST